jgi:shikimate dehydrogenase
LVERAQARGLSTKNKTGKRKVYLLGSGIAKSISPAINNRAYHELGLDIQYTLCDIEKDLLEQKLAELSSERSVIGFNVTIPFKEIIIRHLALLDPVARFIGATNLVVISEDRKRMTGYNTDVDGVVASLSKLGFLGRSNQNAVVLGAGGSARACVYALLNNGFDKIKILNRTFKRAEATALEFSRQFHDKEIKAGRLASRDLEHALSDANIVVNTIPLTAEIPFEVTFSSAPSGMNFLDLNYRKNPPLLCVARKAGIPSIDGSLMLVEQAARSFEILTGISAPRKSMIQEAEKQFSSGAQN